MPGDNGRRRVCSRTFAAGEPTPAADGFEGYCRTCATYFASFAPGGCRGSGAEACRFQVDICPDKSFAPFEVMPGDLPRKAPLAQAAALRASWVEELACPLKLGAGMRLHSANVQRSLKRSASSSWITEPVWIDLDELEAFKDSKLEAFEVGGLRSWMM